MIQFYEVLETITKYAFCITEVKPRKDNENDETEKKNKPNANIVLLIILSNIFEWIDIINLILDLVFVFTKLIGKKEHLGKGITMLIGLVLARLIARRGHILKEKGGLQQWSPFCRPRRRQNEEYYQQNPRSKERNDTLSILYCITFTELSVFFLEDATMIIIWLTTAEFDPSDTWDLVNSWMTVASAIITMSLLILSMLYSSIECHMFYKEIRQRLTAADGKFWRKIGIILHAMVTFFIRLVCSILYTLCFFIIIIGYFLFLLWLVIKVIHMGLEYPIKLKGFFYVLVFFAWAIALYFVVQLFYRTSFKQQQDEDDDNNNPQSTSQQHSSTHSVPHLISLQSIGKDSNDNNENDCTTLENNKNDSSSNNSIEQSPNNNKSNDNEENQILSDQNSCRDDSSSRINAPSQCEEEVNTTSDTTTQRDEESMHNSNSHREVIRKQNSLHIQEEIEMIPNWNDNNNVSTCTVDCHNTDDDNDMTPIIIVTESNMDVIEKQTKEETSIGIDKISIPNKNHTDQTIVSSNSHNHNKEDSDIEMANEIIENKDLKHQSSSKSIIEP